MRSVKEGRTRLCPQFLVCKRKLESKKDALLILSKELDTCQQERDQYKLMANQLRERHQGLKKKYRELIVSGRRPVSLPALSRSLKRRLLSVCRTATRPCRRRNATR